MNLLRTFFCYEKDREILINLPDVLLLEAEDLPALKSLLDKYYLFFTSATPLQIEEYYHRELDNSKVNLELLKLDNVNLDDLKKISAYYKKRTLEVLKKINIHISEILSKNLPQILEEPNPHSAD